MAFYPVTKVPASLRLSDVSKWSTLSASSRLCRFLVGVGNAECAYHLKLLNHSKAEISHNLKLSPVIEVYNRGR